MSVSQSVCQSVCPLLFVPGGQTFLTHRRGGDKHFLNTVGREGTNIFTGRGRASRGGQTFFVGVSGVYDDVDEEMVVSEASKLSAGARILRGP